MTWKAYVTVSGAGLLATYLFSTPGTVMPDPTSAARPEPAPVAQPALDIQEEAARLRLRAPEEPQYQEPSRNPFRFRGRPAPPPQPTSVEPVAPASPAVELPPAPPPIRLSGIMTETVESGRRRSAVLATPAGMITVREGDAVPGGYRVSRIDDDAIELTASDGVSERLSLRP